MIAQRPNDDPHYESAAAAVVAAGGLVETNEYGCWRSVHTCATCGDRFTVCPPSTSYGPDCMADDCLSYDPARDASVFFAPDDPDVP